MQEGLDGETMMSNFKEKFIESYIRDQVRQGGHEERIAALYKMIYDAAKKEFNEDNKPTLDDFLTELFQEILKTRPSKEEVYESLVKQIVQSPKAMQIAIVLRYYDHATFFIMELKDRLKLVPTYLMPVFERDQSNLIQYGNVTIRIILPNSQMRGISFDKVYYSSELSQIQKNEVFYNLTPCVSVSDSMIEFR
jgi:hypothetical protein